MLAYMKQFFFGIGTDAQISLASFGKMVTATIKSYGLSNAGETRNINKKLQTFSGEPTENLIIYRNIIQINHHLIKENVRKLGFNLPFNVLLIIITGSSFQQIHRGWSDEKINNQTTIQKQNLKKCLIYLFVGELSREVSQIENSQDG